MKEWIQDAYNEWLIKYGYRPVTFTEVCCGGIGLEWAEILSIQNALIVVFNKEQDTHNYTLQKLTKEQ